MVFGSVFFGFWALVVVFGICEGVQRLTNAFGDINDTILQLHWYLYPMEIQRLIVPISMYAQKPVEIAFFGRIQCSRQQFRKVSQFENVLVNLLAIIYYSFQRYCMLHIRGLWCFVSLINEENCSPGINLNACA